MLLNVTNSQKKAVLGFGQSIRTIPPRTDALNDSVHQLSIGVTANDEFTSPKNVENLANRISRMLNHPQIGELRAKLSSFFEQIDNNLGRIQDKKLKKEEVVRWNEYEID